MTLKGIIFDLDGTIVNSEYVQFLTFNEWLKTYGETLNWEYWRHHCFGKTGFDILKDLTERFSITVDLNESLVSGLHHYIKLIKNGHLKLLDGFNDFLDWVRSTGLSYIIASNSELPLIETTLKAVDLWSKIDFISSQDVEQPKPDPEIYLLAARRMDLSPEECLIFEDFPACIEAAKAIGSLTVAVKGDSDFNDSFFPGTDLIIEDYRDQRLKAFIQAKMSFTPS